MYILEGNIGTGKSTFLRLVAQTIPNVHIALEPVDTWQNQKHGTSLLANFYEQPDRWVYTFETLTMMSRARTYKLEEQKKQYDSTTLIERSIFSGYYCFGYNSYIQGFMSALEWELYQQWFTMLAKNTTMPTGFIYLRATPEIAYERSKRRNRPAEKSMSLDYIRAIHTRHEEFLIDKTTVLDSLTTIPILVIDVNEEFETNQMEMHKHIHALHTFLEKTRTIDNNTTQAESCLL